MKSKMFKAKIKAQQGYQLNPWEMQQSPYQYPQQYQPIEMSDYGNQRIPISGYNNPAPMNQMEVQPMQYNTTSQAPQNQSNGRGQQIGSMASGFGRMAGQALNAAMVAGPQLLNAMLPEQDLRREDNTLQRANTRYPQGTGSQAIYQDGGKIEPIYVSDLSDQRLQRYNDSMTLYKNTRGTINNLRGLENNGKADWENAIQWTRSQNEWVDKVGKSGNSAYDRLNNPRPISTYENNFGYAEEYKKPIQPIVLQENPKLTQMSTLSNSEIPVNTERPEFNKIGRNVTVPYEYDNMNQGFGGRRVSGYRQEYREYRNGGKMKQSSKDVFTPLSDEEAAYYYMNNIPLPKETDYNEDYVQPTSPYANFTPQPVNVPQPYQPRNISYNRMSDVTGQPTAYLPQFDGYNYNEAQQALTQLPEYIDNIPVVRNNYQDFFQGFQPNSQSNQWSPYDYGDYNPQPLTSFKCGGKMKGMNNGGTMSYKQGEELDLSPEEIKSLIAQGYQIDIL